MVYPSNESLGQTLFFFYVGVFIISCLIITLLNCVSLIILSKPSMRSVKSNHFVVSLAVSDFVVSVLLCPMLAWSSWLPYDNPILISLVVLPHSLLTGSSTATLAAIAYDRYLMTRPSIYDTKMTPRKVKLVLLFVWGVPLLSTSTLFINIQVFAGLVFVFGVVVAIVIVLCYRLIIKRMKRDVTDIPHQQQNISTTNLEHKKRNTNPDSYPASGIDSYNNPSKDNHPTGDVALNRLKSNSNLNSFQVTNGPLHNPAAHNNSTVDNAVTKKQNRTVNRTRIAKNKKLARRFFILIAAFGCCILLSILIAGCFILLEVLRKSDVSLDYGFMDEKRPFRAHLRAITLFSNTLNSILNPLIYVYTYPKFRAELKKMFGWFPFVANTNSRPTLGS